MFLLTTFNFQDLSCTRTEIAANMFYKTFATSQPKAWQIIGKPPAGFNKDLKSCL